MTRPVKVCRRTRPTMVEWGHTSVSSIVGDEEGNARSVRCTRDPLECPKLSDLGVSGVPPSEGSRKMK